MEEIRIKTKTRIEFVDITSQIKQIVRNKGIDKGICYIYVPHTTAAITINENADPSVVKDIENALNKLVPLNAHYAHIEGNADAHIKSTLIGCSKTIFVHNGSLFLGTWQGVFFCEFDGPRNRKVYVKIISG